MRKRISVNNDVTRSGLPLSSEEIPEWGLQALDIFSKTGRESEIYARMPHVRRQDIVELIMRNAQFAYEVDDRRRALSDTLRDAAVHRATKGVKKAIYYQGQVVGHERQPSDALLMFLMKAHDPEMYGDKRTLNVNSKNLSVQIRSFDAQGKEITKEDMDVMDVQMQEIIDDDVDPVDVDENSPPPKRQIKPWEEDPQIKDLLELATPEQKLALKNKLQADRRKEDGEKDAAKARVMPMNSTGARTRPAQKAKARAKSWGDCPIV